jgi:uncharacterized protein (DUF4415 family)
MSSRLLALVAFAIALPALAAAQVAPRPAPGSPPAAVVTGPIAAASAEQAAAPQPAQAPQAPVAATPRPRPEREAHQEEVAQRMNEAERRRVAREEVQSKGLNVRIDATVIESHGEQVTGRKVLTITLVDGEWGSVRSTQQVPFQAKGSQSFSYQPAPLNMDARATLREDGRIRVSLTLEYRGAPSEPETPPGPSAPVATMVPGAVDQGIKQTVTVVLDSGKPLIVAQSSDAVGDRRVALEVKATVLK